MKRFLAFVVSLLLGLSLFAQNSFGGYTTFPDTKLRGLAYKPSLGVSIINDSYFLVLRAIFPDTYAPFDELSRIVLKFEDDSKVTVPLDTNIEIGQKYETSWNNSSKTYSHFYYTFSYYTFTEELRQALMIAGKKITKIRVAFGNGINKDYEIDNKYQPKLLAGLQESYEKAQIIDEQKKKNMSSDDDF